MCISFCSTSSTFQLFIFGVRNNILYYSETKSNMIRRYKYHEILRSSTMFRGIVQRHTREPSRIPSFRRGAFVRTYKASESARRPSRLPHRPIAIGALPTNHTADLD